VLADPGCQQQKPADVVIPFPDAAKAPLQPVSAQHGSQTWYTPVTLNELAKIMDKNRGKKLRLIHGNTSYGIYKEEYLESEILVDIRLIPDRRVAWGQQRMGERSRFRAQIAQVAGYQTRRTAKRCGSSVKKMYNSFFWNVLDKDPTAAKDGGERGIRTPGAR
jgi:hypothetical protein